MHRKLILQIKHNSCKRSSSARLHLSFRNRAIHFCGQLGRGFVCCSRFMPVQGVGVLSVTRALFLFFQPHLLWFPSQEHFHGLWHPGGNLGGACCGGPCSQTSRGKPWRELSRSRNISANQTERNLPVNWDSKIPRYSYKKKKVYQKKITCSDKLLLTLF